MLFRLTFDKKMWRHSWGSYQDRDDENADSVMQEMDDNLFGQKRSFTSLKV